MENDRVGIPASTMYFSMSAATYDERDADDGLPARNTTPTPLMTPPATRPSRESRRAPFSRSNDSWASAMVPAASVEATGAAEAADPRSAGDVRSAPVAAKRAVRAR